MNKTLLTAYLLCLAFLQLTAQDSGMPIIRNYTVEEYRAGQQNWYLAQDRNGVMYFGNSEGLLQFDGVNWRLTRLPIVRSLAIDTSGIIYVGLEFDIGFLEPDETGQLQYHSLMEKIPVEDRHITPVYKTDILDGRVFFLNDEKVLIYKDGQIQVLKSIDRIHSTFVVRDRFYVREWGVGLRVLQNDSLVFVPGSEIFAQERIYVMLPYGEGEILIITRYEGAWIYSPEREEKFRKHPGFKEVDDFMIANWPYCSTRLPNGDYAVGTINAGILVFDSAGRIKSRFDKTTGLQDNTVYYLFVDQQRQLWAALDNGISRIETNLPFRIFSTSSGLDGTPMCLKIHEGSLYVGTSRSTHIRNKDGFFEKIEGTLGQNFDLQEVDGTLLLARNPGVMEVRGRKVVLVEGTDNIPATVIKPVKGKPGLIFLGGDALYLMEKKDPHWRIRHRVGGFDFSVYGIEEDSHGNTWVSTGVQLFRLNLNPQMDSITFFTLYSEDQGLPAIWGWPFKLNSGEVVFGTTRGIYRYARQEDRFIPHPEFPMMTGKVTMFKQEGNGDIWFEELVEPGNSQRGVLYYRDGKYIPFKTPFYKLAYQGSIDAPNGAAIDGDGTVFLCVTRAILQYNPSVAMNQDNPFQTLIRKVTSRDSILYGGNPTRKIIQEGLKDYEIKYSRNDFTFEFAATFFEDAEKNQFSYRLIGSDTTWSNWTRDHKKEYSNLLEGRYTFEVKSINQYLNQGSTASFSFFILPPWYRTWWAILGYLLVLGSLIYLVVHLRTRKLKARSEELERIVEERTAEIQAQKNNVEQLSRIGKDITSSLSIGNIIRTVYENVNTLMDASVFSIGLYNPETGVLEFPAGMEKGQPLPPFTVPLTEENRLAAWCFNHREEVVVNDYIAEYSRYVGQQTAPIAGDSPDSILYLPLWNKEKAIGVITAQSFRKNAYSDYHLNMLRNLATYSAIALENADAYRRLATLIEDLKSTQDKLVTQSKLAALGALTAGIAHEIKNPLNFVNNFAALSAELVEELQEELFNDRDKLGEERLNELGEILVTLRQNAVKVQEHGKRADSIVRSMLQHSRGGSGDRQPTDINATLEEVINLTYHGMRAQDTSFNIRIEKSLDESIGKMDVIPQELSRAFLNIVTNACYEANRKKYDAGPGFMPTLTVTSKLTGNQVKVSIRDNGHGITEEVRKKLFTPFFTTKPAGQGTGLGLSITWDIIVHQHKGQISFETEEGQYTEFIILLPYKEV